MRRTILLALSATLLMLLPSTAFAGVSPNTILKDCFDDGVLQGNYTTAELRNAQNHLPTDIDEYSDCRDVLSRALDAATASKSSGSSGGGGAGTSTGASTTAPSSTSGAAPSATSTPDAANLSDTSVDNTKLPAPYTPQDHIALNHASNAGQAELKSATVPGQRLAATVGRNGVPGILVGVLALLVAASVSLLVKPLLRAFGRR
jgi:hypothetical protein